MPDFAELERKKQKLLEAVREYETETKLYLTTVGVRRDAKDELLDIIFNFSPELIRVPKRFLKHFSETGE